MSDPYKSQKDNNCTSLFDLTEIRHNIPTDLTRDIEGEHIEVFRTYTDCLYAAYGTKWNGNAAALNGSPVARSSLFKE